MDVGRVKSAFIIAHMFRSHHTVRHRLPRPDVLSAFSAACFIISAISTSLLPCILAITTAIHSSISSSACSGVLPTPSISMAFRSFHRRSSKVLMSIAHIAPPVAIIAKLVTLSVAKPSALAASNGPLASGTWLEGLNSPAGLMDATRRTMDRRVMTVLRTKKAAPAAKKENCFRARGVEKSSRLSALPAGGATPSGSADVVATDAEEVELRSAADGIFSASALARASCGSGRLKGNHIHPKTTRASYGL